MRTIGLFVVAAALIGLSACRCNKAPGPQTVPSAQPAAPASTSSASRELGSAGAPSELSDAGAAEGPVVVVMPLDFAPAKGSKYKPVKLKEDGTIARPDKVIAKIANDKLDDDDGSPIASFSPPGTISIAGSEVVFKFKDNDELEGPGGLRISISDEGIPTVVPKAGAETEKLTGKFVDFDPKARRAALVLLAMHELKDAAKAAKPKKPKDPSASGQKKKKKNKNKNKNKNKKE